MDDAILELEFSGEVFVWRGPAPFYFVAVPDELSEMVHAIAAIVTYGWGVIPASVRMGGTTWTTSLFPRDGRYLVPIKMAVRNAERLEEGDVATFHLAIGR